MKFFLWLGVLCGSAVAQAAEYPCEPSPEVASALREVELLRVTVPPDLFLAKARELMAEAVRKHPEDLFAHLRYIFFHQRRGPEDVIAPYKRAMEAHPDDPRYALYYAASLVGTDSPEALRRLAVLTAVPAFPHPRLSIAQVRMYPKFKDDAIVSDQLIQFTEACPGYLPAYENLSYVGKGEKLGGTAVRLRQILSGRKDEDAPIAYRWLWAMEFRAAPPAEHDALRSRVAQDMAMLKTRYSETDPLAVNTFRAGYRIVGDNAGLSRLPEMATPGAEVSETVNRWYREHIVAPGATESDKEARDRELSLAVQQWLERWPDSPMVHLERLQVLSRLPQTTEQAVAAAGADLIAVQRNRPGALIFPPAVLYLAKAYVQRGWRSDEVPLLLETGLREAETSRHAGEFDFADDRNYRLNEEQRYRSRIMAREVSFAFALKRSDLAGASDALLAMRQDLDELMKVATQPGIAQMLEKEHWIKRAELAEVEGRQEEAEGHRARSREVAGRKIAMPNRETERSMVGKQLTRFRAVGLDGRQWTEADLNGKTVVINVWATWCGPCVEELPYWQKLYERLKSQPDVVVLALNVDSGPGVVEPFVKKRNFAFPVLLAHDYINEIFPDLGIPQNWVVSGGKIVRQKSGFIPSDKWVEEMAAWIAGAVR